MHRNRITGPASVHASQHTQIKLVDIARWTVEEHKSTLPEPPDSSRSRRTVLSASSYGCQVNRLRSRRRDSGLDASAPCYLSLIHISEPTRLLSSSYAVF